MTFKAASLTPDAYQVLLNKATEPPFSGYYTLTDEEGAYLCRQCGLALFRSTHKFISSCGWPSFDNEIDGAINRQDDADGQRTEILCQRCDGHLGHAFTGEGLTAKNLRHCVNALSVDFVADVNVIDTQEAIFAGGCFWGLAYYFEQLDGVVLAECGYSGGSVVDPSYEQVCRGETGHVEVVRVVFDSQKIIYQDLVKYFFEIHDPTQVDGQGPDIGQQYLSKVFVYDDAQAVIVNHLINVLSEAGYAMVTTVEPMQIFWPAEAYHQSYYKRQQARPYCHMRQRRPWHD